MIDNTIYQNLYKDQGCVQNDGAGSTAIFSIDQKYRYLLTRKTGIPGVRKIVWLMLNPSTADAFKMDPTVTRCFKRSQGFGANEMVILNLFAYRSPYPKTLLEVDDPVGHANDRYINVHAARRIVVCAWGSNKLAVERAKKVLPVLRDLDSVFFCLGTTKDGHPLHPLHVAYDQTFRAFDMQ